MRTRRNRRVTFSMSEEEYGILWGLAAKDPACLVKKSGRPSLSAYIRRHILHGGQDAGIRDRADDLIYQIRKEGVNINQAARRINAGMGSRSDVGRILGSQERIEGILGEILDLIREESKEKKDQ